MYTVKTIHQHSELCIDTPMRRKLKMLLIQ